MPALQPRLLIPPKVGHTHTHTHACTCTHAHTHPTPPHRRLAWIYTLGTASVKGNFDARPIEMSMSTMQASVCLLFNDAAELTYKEIQARGRGGVLWGVWGAASVQGVLWVRKRAVGSVGSGECAV